jgi:hypothetical protein
VQNVCPARSYRATLIPKNVAADEAELKASQGALPTIQLKAANSGRAEQLAHYLSGLPVLRVDRVEVPA